MQRRTLPSKSLHALASDLVMTLDAENKEVEETEFMLEVYKNSTLVVY